MEVAVVKNKDEIKLYLNGIYKTITDSYCCIIGNIYNLNQFVSDNNLSDGEKVIKAYKLYKEKLFKKLNGEYALILVHNNNIICVRDRMGSKQIYYKLFGDDMIFTSSLSYIINNSHDKLKIDRQSLSNYFCYSYIQSPKTIFKDVSKLEAGSFIKVRNNTVFIKKYYNLVNEYFKNKDRLNRKRKALSSLERSLKDAILKRVNRKEQIGIFFSAGIDSTLIASLTKEVTNKPIYAYTIGFNDEERNEAKRAKKIAEYLGIHYQDFYIDDRDAYRIVHELPIIYSEPLADPSIIPTVFLNQNVQNEMDVILTGDGADQLFCGSSVYDIVFERNLFKLLLKMGRDLIFKRKSYQSVYDNIMTIYNNRKDLAYQFTGIEPNSYYNLAYIPLKNQIKYMLFDIRTFLANRLFSKVSFPANYYNLNISHPFVDNDFVLKTLKLSHKYKYNHKVKKYILKKMLYKRIPEELLNQKKCGFGIPLEDWLYNIYKDDIISLSNEDFIKNQGLFIIDNINEIIDKLNNRSLSHKEAYTLFAYYMFQIWYKTHMEK